MRTYLLCLLSSIGLTSCAYYGDIHGNSHACNSASLTIHHNYDFPHTTVTSSTDWWHKFKDPQLTQLITAALHNSPTLLIAESRVRQAKYLAEEASSALWPSIDLSGYLQRQRFSQYGLVPPPFNGQTFNIAELGFNFNYEFDFWGKNRQTLKARISEARAAQAELAEAQLVISSAVATVYFQLCNDIEQVKIANTEWQLNKQILKIASDRTQHGIESAIPVQTVQANMQTAKQILEHYRQTEALSRHQLAVLVGNNPFTTTIQTKNLNYHPYSPILPASLSVSLLAKRPDIYATKLRAEAAASQIKVAKAFFFPDLNLNALLSLQSAQLNQLFNPASQNNAITGAIDLPIFDAGKRRANLGEKYAEYDIAVNEYNQTILTALREVADQLAILQSIQSQLRSHNIALKAIKSNYKLYTSRYHHGIADYSQVLQIKNLFLQQQAQQFDLETRHLQTIVAMLKALGGSDG